jgi:hypothetical protein
MIIHSAAMEESGSLSTFRPRVLIDCFPPTLAAARWFLASGIRESGGGVARFYYSDRRENARISTEITAYSVGALLDLAQATGQEPLRAAAIASGRFLTRAAWDEREQTFPFEWAAGGALPAHRAYFFDCGIIARALARLWRETRDEEFLEGATRAARTMLADFLNSVDIHPILELPGKRPAARDTRWSTVSDCYQAKAALGWLEVADATGDKAYVDAFERTLADGLRTHAAFPEGEQPRERVMDRLHSYSYFLEALLARAERPEAAAALADGIARCARLLREVRPRFERSDVPAQLLRVRLAAERFGIALDAAAAREEASWCAAFQWRSEDPALDGGYCFGRKGDAWLAFANPVSTAFCAQALEWWRRREAGAEAPVWRDLV